MLGLGGSQESGAATDWRAQRKIGVVAIASSTVLAAVVWLSIRHLAPPIEDMELLGARMLFTLKCCCFAVLFCLVMGVEAVAHERLRSAAFDPLANYESRRFQVNQRYLQNTLEQVVILSAALFGLAAYSPDGDKMRAVLATTVVWILGRFAFWVGYHQSSAMRGVGAPGVMVSMLALIYVVARISYDIAGTIGAASSIAAFLLIEAVLFRTTRAA
jgi:hypothetical protein